MVNIMPETFGDFLTRVKNNNIKDLILNIEGRDPQSGNIKISLVDKFINYTLEALIEENTLIIVGMQCKESLTE